MKNKVVDSDRNKKDNSPIIPQRNKIRKTLEIFQRELTENQKKFIELALDKNTKVLFVSGPAGTAKTFLAVLASLILLNQRRISDIIYVRSVVECSDAKLGFLPGEASEKLMPYLQPLMDKLYELLPKGDIDMLMKEERIIGMPTGFLRGRNENCKSLLLDEAQNCTYKEIVTFMTRAGEYSKVYILGDPEQSDLNGRSGFIKIINIFDDELSRQNGIHVFRFSEADIVRSGLVRFIINKLNSST